MPWRDAAGKIVGTFGLTREITATKIAGDKLEAERKLLRTIIDQLPSRIFVKDAARRYVLNNRTHLLTLGATEQSQVTGRTPFDFLPENRAQQAVSLTEKVKDHHETPWYARPAILGVIVLALTLGLNVIFW